MEEIEREKQVEEAEVQEEVEEERVEEKQEVKEVELPARVLDLIASFVDSSADPQYYFNMPPFMKIIKDGSYWAFEENCVRLVSWRHVFSVCDEITITIYDGWEKVHEFDPLPRTLLSTILVNRRRQRKIRLFEIYRKILFFKQLYKQYLNKS